VLPAPGPLEPPVNKVLQVSRGSLAALLRAHRRS